MNTLEDLFLDSLADMHYAENQLVKALPKMAKGASSEELRNGIEEHLEQTQGHVQRLEQIFEALGESPKGKKCAGMEGLIKEGSEVLSEDYEGETLDAAIIGAAQRIEHYEIAAYGTVKAFAQTLGENDHISLLETTLNEEKETDQKLTDLAEDINEQATQEAEGEEEESEDAESTAGRKKTRRVA